MKPTIKIEKLIKRGFPVWVVGGNHSYQAVMKVREACPKKGFMDTVLVQLWWFENLEDTETISAINFLATRHNVNNEFRSDWNFKDKLHFLRRMYLNTDCEWTNKAQKEAASDLGYSNIKSLNPLLQLVTGSNNKWSALDKVLKTSKEKIGSEAKFRCLQGDLTEQQVVELLLSVVEGKRTLDQMAREATDLKLDTRIKTAAAQLLKCKDFEEVQRKYGLQAFGEAKCRSFFAAFFKLKEKKSSTKKKGRSGLIEVPDTFSRYVEQVRLMASQLTDIVSASLKPFHINGCDHYVFELDVGQLEKIISEHSKFNIGTYYYLFYFSKYIIELIIMDPFYGLGVAEWDQAPFLADDLREVLSAAAFVNAQNNFHLVIFCEWSSYPTYAKVVQELFGPRVSHLGPLVLLKKVFSKGCDLVNAVEVAVCARIGDKPVNFKAKPDGCNIFGSQEQNIDFLKDMHNKVLNPAQKPFEAIKTVVETYCAPGEVVLDLFAGTGQVARAAVELGISSVSVDKDEIQIGFLREFLQKASTSDISSTAVYQYCNQCTEVIAEGEGELICSSCSKPMHKKCAVQGNSEKDIYCSIICKNSEM